MPLCLKLSTYILYCRDPRAGGGENRSEEDFSFDDDTTPHYYLVVKGVNCFRERETMRK